jgi:arylsulfatase A-like enzyme
MIVLTSDHGEELGEHGVVGWHSHALFDELLRVPLIIKYPRSRDASAVVQQQVRSIDIPPTILGVLGLAKPDDFLGIDATKMLAGDPDLELPAVSRMDVSGTRDITALRTKQWKLNQRSLFDLSVDPGEHQDLAVNNQQMMAELDAIVSEQVDQRPRFETSKVVVPEETAAKLKALGYLQ